MGFDCAGHAGTFGYTGWILIKTIGFIVASFVFSYIFWKTKECVENCATKKKKKK